MENLIWVIYLIDVLTQPMRGVGVLLVLTAMFGSVGLIIKVVTSSIENPSANDKVWGSILKKLPLKTMTYIPIALMLLSNLIPSQDTAYKMLAVYGVVEVSKQEDVKEVFGEGFEILKLTMQEYKKELESKGD